MTRHAAEPCAAGANEPWHNACSLTLPEFGFIHMRLTRKRLRILLLAAIVAALAVPVGFALSLEPAPVALQFITCATSVAPTALPALVGTSGSITSVASVRTAQDAVKLLLVGTVLIGLAAAVRKAI